MHRKLAQLPASWPPSTLHFLAALPARAPIPIGLQTNAVDPVRLSHQQEWTARHSPSLIFRDSWFTGAIPRLSEDNGPFTNRREEQPDERTLKLGKTVEILHERLPTLLASPLPQEILSPQISLHLFPSTHPHLPTVSGRMGYTALLWTAPVAWGRVPVVGNIKLVILSERMYKNGLGAHSGVQNEKLIVRWRTCGKSKATERDNDGQVDKITELLGDSERNDQEFSGLFIFQFDEEGRIVKHTIEHAQQGGSFERMTRVVSVTDWLIGLAKNRRPPDLPEYAFPMEGGP